jgi:hypothetical protein
MCGLLQGREDLDEIVRDLAERDVQAAGVDDAVGRIDAAGAMMSCNWSA